MYDTPLIEVDVNTFEREIAELVSISASSIFVEVRLEGGGGAGGGSPPSPPPSPPSPPPSPSAPTSKGGGGGCLGCGGKGGGGSAVADPVDVKLTSRTVILRTTLFLTRDGTEATADASLPRITNILCSAEHPLIKATAKPPSVKFTSATEAMMQAHIDARPRYLETRSLYDADFTGNAQEARQ